MKRTTHRSLPAVLLCLTLVGTACSGNDDGPVAAPSSSPTRSASATVTPSEAPSRRLGTLLSGRTGRRDGPVVAVKIDNTAKAHPQIGVEAADVVYVEEVEGGLTRLAAVYSSTYPQRVGPVRSGRISDIQLLRQYGVAGLIYSGSQGRMVGPLRRSPLKLVSYDASSAGFTRAAGRSAPYDVVGDFAALRRRAGRTTTPTRVGYDFGRLPAGGREAAAVTVRWRGATLRATWSARSRRWLVAMDGRPSVSSAGVQLGGTTFVVQRVKVVPSPYVDVNGSRTPDSRTVGAGQALIFQGGRVYSGRWSRRRDADVTTYTIGGRRAVLQAGQLWVALAGTSRPVTIR